MVQVKGELKSVSRSAGNRQTQMVTTSDPALMNGGMMVQAGGMGPTTVMGQIMGALNSGLVEDLNFEALEHGFDCNVDEVIYTYMKNLTVYLILLRPIELRIIHKIIMLTSSQYPDRNNLN